MALLSLLVLPPGSTAHEAQVQAALSAHRRPFIVDGNDLHGPGGERLEEMIHREMAALERFFQAGDP